MIERPFLVSKEFVFQGCGIAECLKIVCQVGRLDRGKSAILYVKSLLWTETFMNVSRPITVFASLSIFSKT